MLMYAAKQLLYALSEVLPTFIRRMRSEHANAKTQNEMEAMP